MRNRRVLLFLGLNYYVFVKSDVILIGNGYSLGMKMTLTVNTDIYRKSEIIQIR